MTEAEIADLVLGRIGRDAKEGSWHGALSTAELLIAAIARAASARDGAALDAIARRSAEEASAIVLDNDIAVTPSPVAVVWLLKAVAGVAEVAGAGAPRAEDGDSRERIIAELHRAGSIGRTNVELAHECRRSRETVSRLLRQLRAENEIETVSAGRYRRNWLAGKRPTEVSESRQVVKIELSRHEPPPEDNAVERVLELAE